MQGRPGQVRNGRLEGIEAVVERQQRMLAEGDDDSLFLGRQDCRARGAFGPMGHVVTFFAYPESVRRIIYTTNAIEALNAKLRRAVRARGHFPNDDAAMKLLYLVLNNAADEWKQPPREWFEAKARFAVVLAKGSSTNDEKRPRARNS